MKLKFTLAFVCALMLSACTGTQVFKAAEATVHMKLLDAEFDETVSKVRALPMNDYEQSEMEAVIAEAQLEREYLRTLHRQGSGVLMLNALQAQEKLDDLTEIAQTGRQVYRDFLDRTKQPTDPQLKATYQSAQTAKANIQELIDAGGGVPVAELTEYLRLGLRAIAAFNGVPLASARGIPV